MSDQHPPTGRGDTGPTTLSGQEARQGRIVLDTPTRRRVFLSGLVGLGVVVVLAAVLA